MRETIPLRERPVDIALLVFFVINLLFITYIVDLESIVMADPYGTDYPIWPPKPAVDVIHWYGDNFDPVLMARPVWWKATIWIDALFFGPFYLFAIYAYAKGREWIRNPSLIYASVLATNVVIIMSEEIWGPHATPHLPLVAALNAPWLIFPMIIIARMWREHPFTRVERAPSLDLAAAAAEASAR
jgi:hypothetical protein